MLIYIIVFIQPIPNKTSRELDRVTHVDVTECPSTSKLIVKKDPVRMGSFVAFCKQAARPTESCVYFTVEYFKPRCKTYAWGRHNGKRILTWIQPCQRTNRVEYGVDGIKINELLCVGCKTHSICIVDNVMIFSLCGALRILT